MHTVCCSGRLSCHACPPAMDASLLCNPPGHACTPLCMCAPALHVPCYACSLAMHAPCHTHPTTHGHTPAMHAPPLDRITDACENKTFLQLLLRTVNMYKVGRSDRVRLKTKEEVWYAWISWPQACKENRLDWAFYDPSNPSLSWHRITTACQPYQQKLKQYLKARSIQASHSCISIHSVKGGKTGITMQVWRYRVEQFNVWTKDLQCWIFFIQRNMELIFS